MKENQETRKTDKSLETRENGTENKDLLIAGRH